MVIQAVLKGVQFLLGGQFAIDDEIGNLRKPGFTGQLLDGDSTIAEYSFFSIEKGDFALAGSGVPITRIHGNVTGL